jgi:hypothetical protein
MDVARQSAGSNRRNLYVLAGQKRNLAKKSRPPALPIWPHLACVRSAIHEAGSWTFETFSSRAAHVCVCLWRVAGNGDQVQASRVKPSSRSTHAPKHTLALAPTSNNNVHHNNRPGQPYRVRSHNSFANQTRRPQPSATQTSKRGSSSHRYTGRSSHRRQSLPVRSSSYPQPDLCEAKASYLLLFAWHNLTRRWTAS